MVLVWHDGQVVYRKAFGNRSLEPHREAMTVGHDFRYRLAHQSSSDDRRRDATGAERRIRVNEPVAKYIPEFAQNGKEDVTIRELLTHFSGLPEDLDLSQPWQGRDTALQMAYAEKLIDPPGSRFLYSDINFIVLGALVERVSGMLLDQYCRQHIFMPLGWQRRVFCRLRPG